MTSIALSQGASAWLVNYAEAVLRAILSCRNFDHWKAWYQLRNSPADIFYLLGINIDVVVAFRFARVAAEHA